MCDRLATLDSATRCSLLLSESPFDAQVLALILTRLCRSEKNPSRRNFLSLSECGSDAQAEIAELCAIKRLIVGEARHSIGFDHSSGFEPVAEQACR